jgi:hypothetical protein
MKKLIVIVSAVSAFAAVARAYKVYTYQGLPVRHAAGQVPWMMAMNGRGTPDCEGEFDAFQRGQESWNSVPRQWFENRRGDDTDVLDYGLDGVNVVVWFEPSYPGQPAWPSEFGENTIAVNVFWMEYAGAFYKVIENDLCLNGYNFAWSDAGEAGRMDVQNIVTHELGHNLVLNDLYDPAKADYTMYGYSTPGETRKRTLHPDDMNGMRFLYGAPGVRLDEFAAEPRDGAAAVTWRAAYEENHAGYNLYRAEDVGGAEYVKLNGALIRGKSPYTWTDEGVTAGGRYKYLLEAVDLSGGTEEFGPAKMQMPAGTKRTFVLAQSYPNPARDAATIEFVLPRSTTAKLTVYDLSGRKVRTLVDEELPAGEHEVVWNLATDAGTPAAPGIYIYRLQAGSDAGTRRIVIAR